MKTTRRIAVGCMVLMLAACSSGPVRRVSEPAASIQQLTVRPDGSWSVDLRINNYSSMPMQFTTVSLPLTMAKQDAGTLGGNASITIGPESADVVTLTMTPSANARMALAGALSSRQAVPYSFKGQLTAAPDDDKGRGKAKPYDVKRDSQLSPAPGLAGVLR